MMFYKEFLNTMITLCSITEDVNIIITFHGVYKSLNTTFDVND